MHTCDLLVIEGLDVQTRLGNPFVGKFKPTICIDLEMVIAGDMEQQLDYSYSKLLERLINHIESLHSKTLKDIAESCVIILSDEFYARWVRIKISLPVENSRVSVVIERGENINEDV